jgi:hypothetical protein
MCQGSVPSLSILIWRTEVTDHKHYALFLTTIMVIPLNSTKQRSKRGNNVEHKLFHSGGEEKTNFKIVSFIVVVKYM